MDVQIDKIYSEVYGVLNLLGNDYKQRLPKSLFNLIENKRDQSYEPKYNLEVSLVDQKIKRKSLSIIALLHLNYWCDSEEEKEELKKLFKTNEQKHQAYIKEKYNPDNIFKNTDKAETTLQVNSQIVQEENMQATTQKDTTQDTDLAEIKENIFQKIIRKIKSICIKH